MKPSAVFHAHRRELRQIVEGNRATNPRVFGSVADGSDTEGSENCPRLRLEVRPKDGAVQGKSGKC